MDVMLYKMLIDCQIFINYMENCYCGFVSRQVIYIGMENIVIKIFVIVRDIMKQFVMLCNFWKVINVWMISELLIRVRMMMMISRKVEMNLIVKLDDWIFVVMVVEMFRVVVVVLLVIFGCLKGQ